MDCNTLGSSIHGISQARILEWVAISASRESSPPRDRTYASCIARWILYFWDTREAPRKNRGRDKIQKANWAELILEILESKSNDIEIFFKTSVDDPLNGTVKENKD